MKLHTTRIKLSPEQMKADIENRRGYIGGSDIGTILGLNPYKSPYTLWAEKVGLVEPEDISDKDPVWLGHATEELNGKRFAMKTGKKIIRSNYAYSLLEYPYLRAHVDFLVRGESAGMEAKFTGFNRCNYEDGQVPDSHFAQCQFYMTVLNKDAWYLSTIQSNRYHINRIERDELFIRFMLEKCDEFWAHVTSETPMEVDGNDDTSKTLERIYPKEDEGVTVQLTGYTSHLDALQELSRQKKEIETLTDSYKNEIKAFMKDAEIGIADGYKVTWKANSKGSRVFKIKQEEI